METGSSRSDSAEALITNASGAEREHVAGDTKSYANFFSYSFNGFFPISQTSEKEVALSEGVLTRSAIEKTADKKQSQLWLTPIFHVEGVGKDLPPTLRECDKNAVDTASDCSPAHLCKDESGLLFPELFESDSKLKVEVESPHSNSLDSIVFSSYKKRLFCLSPKTIPKISTGLVSASFPNDAVFACKGGGRSARIQPTPPTFSFLSREERAAGTGSLQSMQANETASCSGSSAGYQQHKRRLLQPLAFFQDPCASNAVREQNRGALIAELEKQKLSLQFQLAQLRKEISDQNIFSLVWSSNASRLQSLLETRRCDVNQRDYNGNTPLHLAALGGNVAIVRVLVSFGADVMAVDKMGRTPLDRAAANRHSNVFHYLVNVIQRLFPQQTRSKVNEPTSQESGEDNAAVKSESFFADALNVDDKQSDTALLLLRQTKDVSMDSLFPFTDAEGYVEKKKHLPSNFSLQCTQNNMSSLTSLSHASAEVADSSFSGIQLSNSVGIDVAGKFQRYSSYLTFSNTVSLVVCMVGLPGRGKSYIAYRLSRYLNWKGVPCRVFNAGDYRRKLIGLENTVKPTFYDSNNVNGKMLRDMMADIACDALMKFISQHKTAVGIFDATNTTRERRAHLLEFFAQAARKLEVKYSVIFVESICTDNNLITENILRSKCGNDDFKNLTDTNEVITLFRSRIEHYEKVYEPVDVSEGISFIRIVNAKSHVVLHNIPCGLASRIGFFLLNLHPVAYPIYIVLPGETEGGQSQVYGCSERLTPLGAKFALELKSFILNRVVPHTVVFHSTSPDVLNTLKPLAHALRCGAARGGGCDYGCNEKEKNGIETKDVCNSAVSYFVCHEELLCPLPGLENNKYGCLDEQTAEFAGIKNNLFSPKQDTASATGKVESMLNADKVKNISGDIMGGDSLFEAHHGWRTSPFATCSKRSKEAILRFCDIPDGADLQLLSRMQLAHGESFQQINMRLEPVLMAVMRVQGPIFVVATPVSAKGVFAYVTDMIPEMIPILKLPYHAVVEIGVNGDITVHKILETASHVSDFEVR